jgi:hypothetical protein
MKILSGGQTGVDRAALDAAIAAGIDYGGWCPQGGWAEDLPEPPGLLARYQGLRATPSADPLQRTEWNMRDSDRLILLIDGAGIEASKGTIAARAFAVRLDRPHILLDLDKGDTLARALAFLGKAGAEAKICVAGPRESEAPGVYVKAKSLLCAALGRVAR